MPGKFSLYQDLTVENLQIFATIFGTTIEENYDIIKDIYIQMEPFKIDVLENFRGGMKQKISFMLCFNSNPKYYFSTDYYRSRSVSRKEFLGNAETPTAKGITILVSTPTWTKLCEPDCFNPKGSL
jgi:hypothetical protein